jgi:hypothetical protein
VRRLSVILAAAALIASACNNTPSEPPPTAAVAEVEIPGAPNALSHGNDPLPAKPSGLFAEVAPEAQWPCEGGGTSGRRVQFLYVHGGQSNLASLRPTFETWARQIEGMFLLSGRESGGERLLRLVTDGSCNLSIVERQVSAAALGSFDQMISELRQQGFTDSTRSYHAWVESSAYCGIGTIYSDDRPTGNANEQYAQYARSDRPCWNANTAAHEIIHNLGGVQNSAPNSTLGLHSRDEADVMSYADGAPRGQMIQLCPAPGEDRFDCNKDDYFSAAPPAGSYLATHWNVAESASLTRPVIPTTLPPPPPTSSTTLPPTTSTSVGKAKTSIDLSVPSSISNGTPFVASVNVSGDCRPTGIVVFFVSGTEMSRQVLANGAASVTLTVTSSVSRPTIRSDYLGSDTCATSRDTTRPRLR